MLIKEVQDEFPCPRQAVYVAHLYAAIQYPGPAGVIFTVAAAIGFLDTIIERDATRI